MLFEVAHAARPFRVLAGFAEMRAVGTKVNVYRKSDSTTVTVVEGEATVGLAPGLPGSAAAAGRVVSVQAGDRRIQPLQRDTDRDRDTRTAHAQDQRHPFDG